MFYMVGYLAVHGCSAHYGQNSSGTGQMQGGDHKLASLTSQSSVTRMKLGSNVLSAVLVDTAKVLAINYLSDGALDEILQIHRVWEQLR